MSMPRRLPSRLPSLMVRCAARKSPNRVESIRKLVKKLGSVEQVQACYEAGATGYVLYWQLAELGVKCEVIAPTLVPVKAGNRVKTDRRDAEKLARSYRSGDLTEVWVAVNHYLLLRLLNWKRHIVSSHLQDRGVVRCSRNSCVSRLAM